MKPSHWRTASRRTGDKRYHEKHEEKEEEDLSYPGRRSGNSTEAQGGRDKSNY